MLPRRFTIIVRYDDDSSDYEDRWQTLCVMPTGDVIFAVYTEDEDTVRLISARRAEPFERRTYYGDGKVQGWQRVNP